MRGVAYPSVADIVGLHADVFGIDQRQAADRLIHGERLEGAIGRARHFAAYGDADLALQAAVLAHGLAEAQSFIDGNKRTAVLAFVTFLLVNGFVIDWSGRDSGEHIARWMLDFAHGGTPERLAAAVRPLLAPSPGAETPS